MFRFSSASFLFFIVAARCSLAVDTAPFWSEIRDAYMANLESIATLDMTARLASGYIGLDGKRIALGESVDLGLGEVTGKEFSFRWIRDGSKEFVSFTPSGNISQTTSPICLFVDGKHAFELVFQGPKCVVVQKSANLASVTMQIQGLMGANPLLEVMGWNTIATVAREIEPEVIKLDRVNDVPCWKVAFGKCEIATSTGVPVAIQMTAWFESQFLQQLVKTEFRMAGTDHTRRMVVSAFRQHGGIWVPDTFEIESISDSDAGSYTNGKILSVSLNEMVPSTAFAIPVEYRTADVVNIDRPKEVREFHKKQWIESGASEAQKVGLARMGKEAQERAESVKNQSPSLEPSDIVAVPQGQGVLVLWLGVTGVVLLCMGTILVFRRS